MQDGGMGGMPGGGMGGGMMDSDATAVLTIRGGRLVVDSGGDGLDSNGSLVIEGGETYVNGPSNDGNGPLDCGVSSKVTGGTLIAIGSSGMAQGFGNDSTQGSILATANGSAGDVVEIVDGVGDSVNDDKGFVGCRDGTGSADSDGGGGAGGSVG